MSYGCTDRQKDMHNKLKLLRNEDGWYLPHFTYQRCGIFPTVHTSVVASFPSYHTALWHLPHCTYQRCGIFPILPHSFVVSSPLYIPVLWHLSHLTSQRCGQLHCWLQCAFRTHQTSTPLKLRQRTGL